MPSSKGSTSVALLRAYAIDPLGARRLGRVHDSLVRRKARVHQERARHGDSNVSHRPSWPSRSTIAHGWRAQASCEAGVREAMRPRWQRAGASDKLTRS